MGKTSPACGGALPPLDLNQGRLLRGHVGSTAPILADNQLRRVCEGVPKGLKGPINQRRVGYTTLQQRTSEGRSPSLYHYKHPFAWSELYIGEAL